MLTAEVLQEIAKNAGLLGGAFVASWLASRRSLARVERQIEDPHEANPRNLRSAVEQVGAHVRELVDSNKRLVEQADRMDGRLLHFERSSAAQMSNMAERVGALEERMGHVELRLSRGVK